MPAKKRRAALEVSAALAGVSLRVSREFVEAVPVASKILSGDEIREWGELGRRFAMASADLGAAFFAEGVEILTPLPAVARSSVFKVCTRQLVLSSSVAIETYRSIPAIASEIHDEAFLTNILGLSVEIAARSATHSAEFLRHASAVAPVVERFDRECVDVAEAVLTLTSSFANRTGGMTADLWKQLPDSLSKVSARSAVKLMKHADGFLEFGGSVTLHFISSGAEVLALSNSGFKEWHSVCRSIAAHGNAVLISFLRATPRVIRSLVISGRSGKDDVIRRILQLISEIAANDAESALAAFKSSSSALATAPLEQFEKWVTKGIETYGEASSKMRRSYFALETRESKLQLDNERPGLLLETIRPILRMYVEALTGREIEIAAITELPQESRIGDGKTVYLPLAIAEFDDDELDFRLYKVLAAHGAGQIEFGTFVRDTVQLKAAYKELSALYSATVDQLDAFSLAGYIDEVQGGPDARTELPEREGTEQKVRKLPRNSDYQAILTLFPEPKLARMIFGTIENARIDRRLHSEYRGLRKDLDLMMSHLKDHRPYIFDLPIHKVPFELLFQITLCGGATDDARQFYGQIVSEIESVIDSTLQTDDASVADSLMATSRVYLMFQNISFDQNTQSETKETDENSEFAYDDADRDETTSEAPIKSERQKPAQDVSELFSAWNSLDDEGEQDDLNGAEAWSHSEMMEQDLETGEVAFAYDEWDHELRDYRVGWSRVIEKKVKQGDRTFVELTRSRYRGVISSIRHQFQLMKPENLTRINREIDGEDYNLNALVDFVVDRRADGLQSENIYTKRLRRQRDVAVSLLLDQSSSTARTITRNPNQPYTHPGRRIIEIEKEGLVLMSEALEAVGDIYSINGFTSEGRRNVKYYVIKDFDERYSDTVEKRIGGITFENNTRLGSAIRHAASKLLKQESRTKLLIILTDGRPYDHDYGDARYAREDVRESLNEAKTCGIIPFCITIDRDSESELKDLYGDVGYTIIDDVLSLPERLPNIYKRLTR